MAEPWFPGCSSHSFSVTGAPPCQAWNPEAGGGFDSAALGLWNGEAPDPKLTVANILRWEA